MAFQYPLNCGTNCEKCRRLREIFRGSAFIFSQFKIFLKVEPFQHLCKITERFQRSD